VLRLDLSNFGNISRELCLEVRLECVWERAYRDPALLRQFVAYRLPPAFALVALRERHWLPGPFFLLALSGDPIGE